MKGIFKNVGLFFIAIDWAATFWSRLGCCAGVSYETLRRIRGYSTTSFNNSLKHSSNLNQLSFIEWFRGFIDAEGYFLIAKVGGNSFAFRFIIKLHKDDLNLLNFIKNFFKIGNVLVDPTYVVGISLF